MNFHPFSEIFPLIEGADFDALVADIKANGLREKIWLYDGKILDGRNRFLACQKAKVKPGYRKYTGTNPLAFVVSLNVQRRHLSASQLSMAAARIATLRTGQRADHVQGVPIGTASEMTGASERGTKRARQVLEKGSKALQKAVDSGEVTVSKAAAVVDLPKAEQLSAARQKQDPDAPERPDDVDEDAALAAAENELLASAEKALGTDAFSEIKRLTAELAVVKTTRDGYMRGKDAVTKLLQTEQRKTGKLEKDIAKLRAENEGLRERIALMEAA